MFSCLKVKKKTAYLLIQVESFCIEAKGPSAVVSACLIILESEMSATTLINFTKKTLAYFDRSLLTKKLWFF